MLLDGSTSGYQIHLRGYFEYYCMFYLRVFSACVPLGVISFLSVPKRPITSPPSHWPRCYHDQVYTRRPLLPGHLYRGKIRTPSWLLSRSLVKNKLPRTRHPRNVTAVPRKQPNPLGVLELIFFGPFKGPYPQIHSFHNTIHHGKRSSRASRTPHHSTLVRQGATPRRVTLRPCCDRGVSP